MEDVTFCLTSLVRILVNYGDDCTNDALRQRWNEFKHKNLLYPVVHSSGSGSYSLDYYTPEDAEKVKKWFLENGAKETLKED